VHASGLLLFVGEPCLLLLLPLLLFLLLLLFVSPSLGLLGFAALRS
jgi:hypothetical protein